MAACRSAPRAATFRRSARASFATATGHARAQQRPHLAHDLAHPGERGRRARRAGLDQHPRAVAQPDESPGGERASVRRAMARWPRSIPHAEDGRADADAARSHRRLREDDLTSYAQSPAAAARRSQGARRAWRASELLAAVLQRHHRDGSGRATAAMLRHPASAGRIFLATSRAAPSSLGILAPEHDGGVPHAQTRVFPEPITTACARRQTFSLTSSASESRSSFPTRAGRVGQRARLGERSAQLVGVFDHRVPAVAERDHAAAGPPSCCRRPRSSGAASARLGSEAAVANAIELRPRTGSRSVSASEHGKRLVGGAPRLAKSDGPGSPAPAATSPAHAEMSRPPRARDRRQHLWPCGRMPVPRMIPRAADPRRVAATAKRAQHGHGRVGHVRGTGKLRPPDSRPSRAESRRDR